MEEDDTLLSIETDKVTVDVRTPVAGVVKSILVSPDDSVEVGRVVAVVTEGEARGAVESSLEVEERHETSSKATSATVTTDDDVMAAGKTMERVFSAASAGVSHGGAYVPSISFPTRRTVDGRMISEMSEDEQKRVRGEELSAIHSARFLMRTMEAGARVRAPPLMRRAMTDREMEMIMLGGAE